MPNRLANESSPYLLQHAHNPVDWYPWGEEALQLARVKNIPIFLSVGYSTCYWCHVMERECFENESIAAQMNANFINIKVDREERPDVDQLYMTAVQIITKQGGWPMSVFLTPDLRPFYAGTYFPPSDRHGRPGFPRVLSAVRNAFDQQSGDVNLSADQVTRILRDLARPRPPQRSFSIDDTWLKEIIDRSTNDFDDQHAGFGSAPKFPRETLLELMLVYLRDHQDAELTRMLTRSLDAMAYGGIRDHLGGGFHRYSTDARWLVPHFEIMLYDNAMLVWIYAEAFARTKEYRYATVARGIADFLIREMTSPEGAFFTALDAEVDGREGANYLWTREQVESALSGKTDVAKFVHAYGLDEGPNFADPHHGNGVPDQNVLFLAEPDNGAALTDAVLRKSLEILYEIRKQRKQPRLDNKFLTSWNALAIRGLAHASKVLDDPRYLKAAQRAADYLLRVHLNRDPDETQILNRVSSRGAAKQRAFLDDYAFLSQALLALPGAEYHGRAIDLARAMKQRFASDVGGFYFTDDQSGDLPVRQIIAGDSPLPSGNAVAAMVLTELGDYDGARSTIVAFASQLETAAEQMSAMIEATILYREQRGDISVVAGGESARPLAPSELAAKVLTMAGSRDGLSLRVRCNLSSGYHINAHNAKVEPTRLTVSGVDVAEIEYPHGEMSGEFTILVKLKKTATERVSLNLRYQACDASACLPPTSKSIMVDPI
jgi:uncharacterized protein YyaL (SSP411 family)